MEARSKPDFRAARIDMEASKVATYRRMVASGQMPYIADDEIVRRAELEAREAVRESVARFNSRS